MRSTGTSNAAALTTRSALWIAEELAELAAGLGQRWQTLPTRAVMVKALLVHGAAWGDVAQVLDGAYPPPGSRRTRRRRETITRFLGYGSANVRQVLSGEATRITLLADDMIAHDQHHEYRIPIPRALLGGREARRITLTLAWCPPIMPTVSAYRSVALTLVGRDGTQNFWNAVGPSPQPHPDDTRRGTVIHRRFEGSKMVSAGASEIYVGVQARAQHPDHENGAAAVPYALAITIEVAQSVRADIYEDVRGRVRLRTRERVRERR